MIATLTLNPAIDLTVLVSGLNLGMSHRVGPHRSRAGGKGVNVARVLHGQRIPALVLAPVGGEPGSQFAAELQTAGIPHTLVAAAADTRLSTSVFETDTGRATLFNEHGSPLAESTVAALRDAIRDLADVSCLVIAGSIPAGTDPAVVGDFVGLAGERGIPTIVDTGGPALLAAAAAGATLLKPNTSELAAATGVPDPAAGLRALLAAGARHVVVTAGKDGMLSTDGTVTHVGRPPAGITGNPTGAGDAATASFAHAVSRGGPAALTDPETLAHAVAWSASAVLTPVAGELGPTWHELLGQVGVHAHSDGEGDPACPW
ncbi:MAG: hexose kinase [Propionicimonas sp.]